MTADLRSFGRLGDDGGDGARWKCGGDERDVVQPDRLWGRRTLGVTDTDETTSTSSSSGSSAGTGADAGSTTGGPHASLPRASAQMAITQETALYWTERNDDAISFHSIGI